MLGLFRGEACRGGLGLQANVPGVQAGCSTTPGRPHHELQDSSSTPRRHFLGAGSSQAVSRPSPLYGFSSAAM